MEERESPARRARDASEPDAGKPDASRDAAATVPPEAPAGADAPARRGGVLRDSIGVGLATAAYGISFGALAVAAALVATLTTPVLMPGLPVIVAAFVAIVVGWLNWLGAPEEPGEWDEPVDVAEREGLP